MSRTPSRQALFEKSQKVNNTYNNRQNCSIRRENDDTKEHSGVQSITDWLSRPSSTVSSCGKFRCRD